MFSTLLSIFFLFPTFFSKSLEFTDYNGCVFNVKDFNGVESTYNLSLFHQSDSFYRVKQSNYESSQREYLFNICGRIPRSVWKKSTEIYDECRNSSLSQNIHGPCEVWSDDGTCSKIYDVIDANISATALQYTKEHQCHWVGSELDGKLSYPDYNVTLYDETDSASGIIFTLRNGDYCDKSHKGVYYTNRELNIEFICPDSPRKFFNPIDELNITEDVIQYPTCIYTLSYETALACPSQCISVNNSLEKKEGDIYSVCNGRGICVADPNYGKSRCICDDGWTGELCTAKYYDIEIIKDSHGSGSLTAITWICVILLIIMVIFSVVLCHKIRMQERFIVGKQDGQYVQGMLDGDEQGQFGAGVSMGVSGQGLTGNGMNPLITGTDDIGGDTVGINDNNINNNVEDGNDNITNDNDDIDDNEDRIDTGIVDDNGDVGGDDGDQDGAGDDDENNNILE